MRPRSKFYKILLFAAVGAVLAMAPARADWLLDEENSHLAYGSIKKNSIGESNHFQKMEGRISDSGAVTLLIDLGSVETWVDIRNERMKEFFFKTKLFPVASLSGQVDMAQFQDMAVGSQRTLEMTFEFTLHGESQNVEAELAILRLSEDKVVILNHEIIFLDVEKFNLLPGLKKLQELAKLPSISTVVPVVFHLTFTQTP